MNVNVPTKVFFYCCFISLLLLLYYVSLLERTESVHVEEPIEVDYSIELFMKKLSTDKENKELKYILQWTSPKNEPFVDMGVGRQAFIIRNCPYSNCFVTSDRSYFKDYSQFDVIVFAGPEVVRMSNKNLPSKRSPHQKFVFASMESPDYYPACSNRFDGYFNWTWTYKLNSDSKWGYVVVKDSKNKVIGPKINMNWIQLKDMKSVGTEIRAKLRKKTKAAVWFVSNCPARSGRDKFVEDLQEELKKFDLKVDIYGRCSSLSCPRNNQDECNKMIEKDYYFYLSFENSFAEDYVTEKLLYPLQHLAVPIVYGGANYTRFMPDGIYINARELGPQRLAKKMNELIKDPDQYADYFKWMNHYSYYNRYESMETNDICRICSIVNEEETVRKTTVYENFREWWDPPGRC